MQIIKINGKPATSGQLEVMLDKNEKVEDLDISNFSIGSIAYTADRSEIYSLDTGYTWRKVVKSGSSSSSVNVAEVLSNSEIEEMLT